jgi:hypothetical protein
MGERTLGIGLFLLSIAFLVVPLLVALGTYGLSPDLVMPSPNPIEELENVEELEYDVGEFEILGDLDSFAPENHYVISWEDAESKLVDDLGQYVIGNVDLGNVGSYAGHSPSKDIPGIGCAGDSTPDNDDTPDNDCINPNDGIAPVFEFSASPGPLMTPLPMDVPAIVGRHDPTNAVVVRSSIDAIKAAFIDAGWEFEYPCEGYLSDEPHTPMGELAGAFLDVGNYQYHVRIFYGGHNSIYGDWYYVGAHYEGQNFAPAVGTEVSLTNPFSFPITIENIDVEVLCASDDYPVGLGRLDGPVDIQPKAPSSFNIVLGFTYEGFNHLLDDHLVGTSIDTSLNLEGTVQVKVYEIMITVPFEQNVQFPSEVEIL